MHFLGIRFLEGRHFCGCLEWIQRFAKYRGWKVCDEESNEEEDMRNTGRHVLDAIYSGVDISSEDFKGVLMPEQGMLGMMAYNK
jgi:hypothetical protein